jgi:general secretion pathway protein F
MAAYSYKALSADGTVSKGILEGESERQVRNLLRQRQLKPIEVIPARDNAQTAQTAQVAVSRQTLRSAELALFTRQLATLVRAGVTLDEALAATARQTATPHVKSLLLQIRGKVVAGHSLAASLAAFPQAFSDLYRAMVRAGEHAGLLGEVLEHLAVHIERRHYLQQKLQMALVYPAVLLAVALGVIMLLMTLVVPDLVALFDRTETQLPLLTRMLIAFSDFVASWWWLSLLLVVAAVAALRRLLREPRWQLARDRFVLRLPLLGRLAIAADTTRFAATLSILTSSGVALVEALGVAAAVMTNLALRARTQQTTSAVQEGGSLARALESCGFFSPMLVQMVASGESSGTLEALLQKAAEAQERELELTLDGLLKLLEPLVIVIMAIVVGALVLAVLLPIMQMNTLVA